MGSEIYAAADELVRLSHKHICTSSPTAWGWSATRRHG